MTGESHILCPLVHIVHDLQVCKLCTSLCTVYTSLCTVCTALCTVFTALCTVECAEQGCLQTVSMNWNLLKIESPCHCLPVPVSLSDSPMSLSDSPRVTVWQSPCHCLQSPCHCLPVPMSLSALSARCVACRGPDVTLCGGLGSEHLPTNKLITWQHALLVSVPLKRKVCYFLGADCERFVLMSKRASSVRVIFCVGGACTFPIGTLASEVWIAVCFILCNISAPVYHTYLSSCGPVCTCSACASVPEHCVPFCCCCCWSCFSASVRLLTLCREVYCNEISSGWVWGLGWGYNVLYCNYLIVYMPLRCFIRRELLATMSGVMMHH